MTSQSAFKVAMLGYFAPRPEIEEAILGCEVDKFIETPEEKETLLKTLAGYDGLLMWHDCGLNAAELKKLKQEYNSKLKGIVRIGMGYDNVDIQAAGSVGISVSNVPDYGTEEVADTTFSLILSLTRKTYDFGNLIKYENKYIMANGMKGARRTRGMVLGLVGFGNIGKCVCERAKAFGFKIQFYDPYVGHGIDKAMGVTRVDTLDELLATSDVVSVHTWLSSETKHLINENNIFKMKQGSFLVNTARGPIVQEKAVVAALKSGHLAGAGLDVLEVEPYDDKHLVEVPNLIITPHCAFYSEEGFIEMRDKAAQELKRIFAGKPKYSVNAQFLQM